MDEVYVVVEWYAYEGEIILGVFSSEEKAKDFLWHEELKSPMRGSLNAGREIRWYKVE